MVGSGAGGQASGGSGVNVEPGASGSGGTATATGGVSGAMFGGASGANVGMGGTGAAGAGGALANGGANGAGATGGATSAPSDAASDLPSTPSGPPVMGGKALLITGTIPLVGTDVQFEAALKARGLEVEIVQEKLATPKNAEGKRIIMFSYGMSSTAFVAEPFTDVPVPIIVTEHNLLPRIKMSSQHGFTGKLTKLTMISNHELAGGFPMGDLEVYGTAQEMFWGSPSPAGIKVAHILGMPDKVTFFAYDKGAMMDGVAAPAKRVQFFHASHSPDPIDKNLYLNDNGLKLLGVTIDWCLK